MEITRWRVNSCHTQLIFIIKCFYYYLKSEKRYLNLLSFLNTKMAHTFDIHYDDVIMTTMAAQITSLTVVYSTVYSDANQRKHQSSASLAFVWGIHRDRWIPRTKGQLRGKCFHLMTSSWFLEEGNGPFILKIHYRCCRWNIRTTHSQYRCCWWHGHAKSQCISSHGMFSRKFSFG